MAALQKTLLLRNVLLHVPCVGVVAKTNCIISHHTYVRLHSEMILFEVHTCTHFLVAICLCTVVCLGVCHIYEELIPCDVMGIKCVITCLM